MKHDLLHRCKEKLVPTDAAILEAALDQFARTGLRRTSTDDIARRAGVNRATVYRRFGTREQLVQAAFLHEAGRVLEELTTRVPDVPSDAATPFDPVDNVVTAFTEAVALLRSNALLSGMRELDPELVAIGTTTGAADVLGFAADVLGFAADVLAQRVRDLHAWRRTEPPADPLALGQTFARLVQSLVLTPDAGPDLGSPDSARQYARSVVVPLVLGH
jgi:AcrR family transcriptional regulator